MKQYNILIKVNGILDRTIGQIVKLKYPKIYNEERIQNSFDGNWFIMAINHIIMNDGGYEQNILLSKNAKFNFDELEKCGGKTNI